MSDFDKEWVDSLAAGLDEKSVHFSQLGSIQESSLGQLRDHIKKVMIPLLIKTFQYQFESKPSSEQSTEAQLKTLDNDLQNLQLWCQSCRSQIQRALDQPKEKQKGLVATSETHLNISTKSWWKRVFLGKK